MVLFRSAGVLFAQCPGQIPMQLTIFQLPKTCPLHVESDTSITIPCAILCAVNQRLCSSLRVTALAPVHTGPNAGQGSKRSAGLKQAV